MISAYLLDILRCPKCVGNETRRLGEDWGHLILVSDCWLVCQEAKCGCKYPIRNDIPTMLIDEGEKWISVAIENLPVPPSIESS